MLRRSGSRLLPLLSACLLGVAAAGAQADSAPMTDDDLAGVSGAGVDVLVHLSLNAGVLAGQDIDSRIVMGFNNNGSSSYAVLQNLAGIVNLIAITINMRTRSAAEGGGDYFDITLPQAIEFQQFGVRAIAATSAPDAPITTANSYGSLILNGALTGTGHFYLWPKP